MPTFIRSLILLALLLLSNLAFSNSQESLELYKQRLEQLDATATTSQDKEQRELYQKIIAAWQDAVLFEQQAMQSRNQLERIPAEIKKIQQSLSESAPSLNIQQLKKQSASELEQKLTLEKAKLLELEQGEKQVQKQIKQSSDTLITLRTELASLKQQEITEGSESSALNDAEFAARAARIQALEFRLLTLPGINELNQIKAQRLTKQLEHQRNLIKTLQDLLQDKRRTEAEQTLEQVHTESDSDDLPAPIIEQQARNQKLSQNLRAVVTLAEDTLQQRRLLERKLDLFKQSYMALQLQTELSRQPLGPELSRFTQHLEADVDTLATKKQLNELRLMSLDISRSELMIDTSDERLLSPGLSDEQLSRLKDLQYDYRSIAVKTQETINQALNELSELLSVQEQFSEQANKGKELISQQLLWIPSVPPLSPKWFSDVLQGIPSVLSILVPTISSDQKYVLPSDDWIASVALWLILVAVSLLLYPKLRKKQGLWAQYIGNVVNDRFLHTFQATWMPLVVILPVPAGVYLLLGKVFNTEVWQVDLSVLAPVGALASGIYLALIYWLKTPEGLLPAHLSVSEGLCSRIRKRLHLVFWFGAFLVLVIAATEQTDNVSLRSGAGRAALMALALMVTLFCISLYRSLPVHNSSGAPLWQQLRPWLGLNAGGHLLIVIAAIMGYTFTGQTFMYMLLVLSSISVLTFLFYRFCNRWLLIEERRLAFERARARRNEILEAREKNEEVPPLNENYLDLQTISDQARVLLRATTGIVFFLLFWAFLKNALPAFDVLDSIVLWSNDITTSEGIIPEPITLKSILVSVILIGLCILAAYNLPGLLELLVLRHLTLSPGTSYAITTITRYILIMTSFIAGTGQLGLDWSKLQWLVAALGVGLGFGLQEIVANFVSGLIILFEKPIRIGDTVTIGNYSGTVTRIQIRATTIADWDRKEIIIPNKNFVTDQLINWSLTDPITRVILSVGIAHGSDTELAKKLMLDVASKNQKVLKDPEPNAFFMKFGPSTLNLELRLFVNDMDDRLIVTHEVNQAIAEAFRAHDIQIAYQQIDVNIKKK